MKAHTKETQGTMTPKKALDFLKEGNVQSGDTFILKETTEKISIKEVYSLFSDKNKNLELAKKSCAITTLSKDCKNAIKKRFNI